MVFVQSLRPPELSNNQAGSSTVSSCQAREGRPEFDANSPTQFFCTSKELEIKANGPEIDALGNIELDGWSLEIYWEVHQFLSSRFLSQS
jgi:hypothetical protein